MTCHVDNTGRYVVLCDAENVICDEAVWTNTPYIHGARSEAEGVGWQTPLVTDFTSQRGDYCPEHRTDKVTQHDS